MIPSLKLETSFVQDFVRWHNMHVAPQYNQTLKPLPILKNGKVNVNHYRLTTNFGSREDIIRNILEFVKLDMQEFLDVSLRKVDFNHNAKFATYFNYLVDYHNGRLNLNLEVSEFEKYIAMSPATDGEIRILDKKLLK
jgi:hypothetical protein